MKTAKFIRALDGFIGEAALFKLSEPLEGHDHVVVSATVVPFTGPETYIFPANPDGRVKDYGELAGSYRGGLNIAEALENAGYEVSYETP